MPVSGRGDSSEDSMLNRCLLLSQFFVSLAVPVYNATAAHGYQLLPALPASSTVPCCVVDPSCSSTDFLASGIEDVHGFLNGLQTVNLQVTPVGDALLDRPIIERPSSVTSVNEDRKASPASFLFSGRGDSSEDSMLNRCLLLSQFFVSLAVPVYNATAAHGYQLLPALPASSTVPCCVVDPSCSSTDFLASGIEDVHGFLNGLQTVNLQVTPVGDALLDRPIIERPSSVTSVNEDRKASPASFLFSGRGDSSEDSMLNRCLLLSQLRAGSPVRLTGSFAR
ncbi:hypothetical protein ISCGN_012073 [Ixodes scapularis]